MTTKIKNLRTTLLNNGWSKLKQLTYEYCLPDGTWESHTREAYDRGDGAVVLLFNPSKRTVILTKQFRIPTYMNHNPDGMMIEACAGKLEEDPEECVRREALEETGYKIGKVTKVFEAYMSPGSVTELLHCFIAEVDESMKVSKGGGAETEQENIEVLEVSFKDAMNMIRDKRIQDAKTIMLIQHLALTGHWEVK